MTRRRTLDEFTAKGCIGWCYAPETAVAHPDCDVAGCEATPKFEVFFRSDEYWYYMCGAHKRYLDRRRAVSKIGRFWNYFLDLVWGHWQ